MMDRVRRRKACFLEVGIAEAWSSDWRRRGSELGGRKGVQARSEFDAARKVVLTRARRQVVRGSVMERIREISHSDWKIS